VSHLPPRKRARSPSLPLDRPARLRLRLSLSLTETNQAQRSSPRVLFYLTYPSLAVDYYDQRTLTLLTHFRIDAGYSAASSWDGDPYG
jgi:hypothetical protein